MSPTSSRLAEPVPPMDNLVAGADSAVGGEHLLDHGQAYSSRDAVVIGMLLLLLLLLLLSSTIMISPPTA